MIFGRWPAHQPQSITPKFCKAVPRSSQLYRDERAGFAAPTHPKMIGYLDRYRLGLQSRHQITAKAGPLGPWDMLPFNRARRIMPRSFSKEPRAFQEIALHNIRCLDEQHSRCAGSDRFASVEIGHFNGDARQRMPDLAASCTHIYQRRQWRLASTRHFAANLRCVGVCSFNR